METKETGARATPARSGCACLCASVCVGASVRRLTNDAVHGQDVLVDEFNGAGSVGDLIVEVIGQTSSL